MRDVRINSGRNNIISLCSAIFIAKIIEAIIISTNFKKIIIAISFYALKVIYKLF